MCYSLSVVRGCRGLSKCVEISRPALCVGNSSPALLQCKCPPPGEQQQRGFFLPKFPTPFPAKIKSEVFRYAEQRILGYVPIECSQGTDLIILGDN